MKFIKEVLKDLDYMSLITTLLIITWIVFTPYVSVMQTITFILLLTCFLSLMGYVIYSGVKYVFDEIRWNLAVRKRRALWEDRDER